MKIVTKTLQPKIFIFHSIIILLLMIRPELQAQKVIHISGKVIDRDTKHPIPFANIVLVGKNKGTITDYKGNYNIDLEWETGKIEAQLMGYQNQIKPVSLEKNQVINFALNPQSLNLNEVVVAGKKLKYRNKDNPAVALIRKVIRNKSLNRKGSLDYYQYDKYNKLEFALNKADEKLLQNKIFKKYQFVFHYTDTSELNGETYLPVFLKESKSKIYYRKTPRTQKEYVMGNKMSGFPNFVDKQGFGSMLDRLIQSIDIYDNNIFLLTNQFVSPLSVIAPSIYKFRIIDTLNVNGYNCINVAFQPRNKADFAFGGNLYITNDNRYAVVKAVMGIPKGINLNFVKGLRFVQEFKDVDNKIWMRTKDRLVIDFNIAKGGLGMLGKKTDYYSHYILNQKQNDSVYSGIENKIIMPEANARTDEFWAKNRTEPLQKEEKNVYVMLDSIQHMPAYKRSVNLLMLIDEGYWNFGKIDLGPTNTFYSFNNIEGHRLRIAARTSTKFSKLLRIDGNITYGFKDKKYKYGGSAIWSLNKIPLNGRPTQTISVTYQNETEFPGMKMQLVNEDNFFLSFKRGVADKILYYKLFQIQHYLNWGDGFSTTFSVRHLEEQPGGNWQFNSPDFPLSNLTTSELSAMLRFAPNEKYYQGMDHRTPIITKYPVIELNYTQGFKNVLNSDYTYTKLSASVFKRLYFGLFGYLDSYVDAGKVFGNGIPYPLLYLHRANQTYSYQPYSYNMMNFLEFVSDKYASYFGEYHFNGFLFNQIPLLKHLKWRGVVSFKALYGGLSDKNNPEKTPGLMLFPTDANGNPTTFVLKNRPYMEASIGVENIFKAFRVDLVKRLTYLNNPNVTQYGIRVSFKIDF